MKKSLSQLNILDLTIYRNENFLVMNKPSGILSQKDPSDQPDILSEVVISEKQPCHLHNRLDQPVSGVLVVGLKKLEGDIKWTKKYMALTAKTEKQSGDLSHWLKRDGQRKKALLSRKPMEGYKKGELSYRVIKSYDHVDLVEITLKTGRFHQIRAQLAQIGRPIRGDVKYGSRRGNKDRSIDLHAYYIKGTGVSELECYAPPKRDSPLWREIEKEFITPHMPK
ncbi:MAG: 23S rRNA pseudouridine1911/1915/1917 synthase [Saprospiraceae bacterium]|jgi:23S rRNA pseudouridine1911/1915/1917 synthase